jgi:hypothetical protein
MVRPHVAASVGLPGSPWSAQPSHYPAGYFHGRPRVLACSAPLAVLVAARARAARSAQAVLLLRSRRNAATLMSPSVRTSGASQDSAGGWRAGSCEVSKFKAHTTMRLPTWRTSPKALRRISSRLNVGVGSSSSVVLLSDLPRCRRGSVLGSSARGRRGVKHGVACWVLAWFSRARSGSEGRRPRAGAGRAL